MPAQNHSLLPACSKSNGGCSYPLAKPSDSHVHGYMNQVSFANYFFQVFVIFTCININSALRKVYCNDVCSMVCYNFAGTLVSLQLHELRIQGGGKNGWYTNRACIRAGHNVASRLRL